MKYTVDQDMDGITRYMAIHPIRHNKLMIAIRTAVENGEDSLDKETTSHDDLFDAFRMSLMFWY